MGGKKKAASGDPSKGEKVFKNLCGVCHSLSVSKIINNIIINKCIYEYRLTLLVQLLEVLEMQILLVMKDSVIHRLYHLKLPLNGLQVI